MERVRRAEAETEAQVAKRKCLTGWACVLVLVLVLVLVGGPPPPTGTSDNWQNKTLAHTQAEGKRNRRRLPGHVFFLLLSLHSEKNHFL